MTTVVGIRFKTSSKTYFFDPQGEVYKVGEKVIAETARGYELLVISQGNKEVATDAVVLPLKPILRRATDEDIKRKEANDAEKAELLRKAQETAEKFKVPMKCQEAEYTFDRSKVVIYYTAENRIDFKIIVKELATELRNRIELRQIYDTEEIGLLSQYGCCGRPCCCTTFLKECAHANMKMAKIQNLAMNPQKLAGCCGRTMCCIKYEHAQYLKDQGGKADDKQEDKE
ncbi:MAG: stage 0 sporulation protein [Christensenellaceae bacterium]|jgi:cell fate regulator YaaT (PSP1 superfamily)|nr:stage 0 sporulation protein [Christensenellaceae bacterium]